MARRPGKRWPDNWFVSDARVAFDPSVAGRLGNWWYDIVFVPFGLSPREFGLRLIADLDLRDKVEFLSFDRRSQRVSVKMTGVDGNALVYLAGHTLTLVPAQSRAEVDLLSVDDAHQGQGIGATIMANLVDLGRSIGVEKIGLRAGLDAGPYAWIRFGFFPTDPEWAKIKPRIRQKLEGLGRMVTEESRMRVQAALASPSGRAVAIIAAEEDVVMSRPAFGGPPRDVPLERALLADSRIRRYGELVFADADAMSIFTDCVERNRVRRTP